MKNFSTQVLGFVFSLLAAPVFAAGPTGPLELAGNAPDKYVVVKGDTLWGIAGKFLKRPWYWPQIWQLNREQIANPHLIYPGDIVYLDESGSQPRLRLAKRVGGGTTMGSATSNGVQGSANIDPSRERLSPRMRTEAQPATPVPTIDIHAIEPFLSRPLIIDPQALAANPRIIATQDGRVYLSRGELAYVRGNIDESKRNWYVYRGTRPLTDPVTRKPLAWEAEFVGTAELERGGDPATFRVTGNTSEIGPGDRLIPADPTRLDSFAPRAPEAKVHGSILSIYKGVAQAGRNSVVALNLGTTAGLSVGHVLEIRERGRLAPDREAGKLVQLPGEPIGHLLVFRVFDKIAYALIMNSSRDVNIGDEVLNP